MIHRATAALVLFTLLINHSVFARNTATKDSSGQYKKFTLGVDLFKLPSLTGYKYNNYTTYRGEFCLRYYPHKNFYASVGAGFGSKNGTKVAHSTYHVEGSYYKLGVGGDVSAGRWAHFVFGYNFCYADYHKRTTVMLYNAFWNETYQTDVDNYANKGFFQEVYAGFRVNLMRDRRIGIFIENDFRFRFSPIASKSLNQDDYMPGYGNFNARYPFFFAVNIMGGICF